MLPTSPVHFTVSPPRRRTQSPLWTRIRSHRFLVNSFSYCTLSIWWCPLIRTTVLRAPHSFPLRFARVLLRQGGGNSCINLPSRARHFASLQKYSIFHQRATHPFSLYRTYPLTVRYYYHHYKRHPMLATVELNQYRLSFSDASNLGDHVLRYPIPALEYFIRECRSLLPTHSFKLFQPLSCCPRSNIRRVSPALLSRYILW